LKHGTFLEHENRKGSSGESGIISPFIKLLSIGIRNPLKINRYHQSLKKSMQIKFITTAGDFNASF
jgi:hypothetical protein